MTTSTSPILPAEKPRRVRRTRRWIVLGILVAAGCAIWFARARLLGRVVARLAASQVGLDVRFEGLKVEGISRIRADRVTATARGATEPVRSLEIVDLDVEIDVSALWHDGLPVNSVRAAYLRADLDLTHASPAAREASSTKLDLGILRDLPQLDLGRADVEVRAPNARARLANAHVEFGPPGGARALRIGADELDVHTTTKSLGGALTLEATLAPEEIVVTAARLGDDLVIRTARFEAQADGQFTARLDAHTELGDVDVEVRSRNHELAMRGALVDVEVAPVLDIIGLETDEYGGTWTARGVCVLPLDAPWLFTADLEANAVDPLILGRSADALSGRFLADAQRFQIERTLVLSGPNTAEIPYASVPREADLGCEFLQRATFVLDADLTDLAAILGESFTPPADAPPHRVRASVALADGWLAVEQGTIDIGPNRIEVGETHIPLATGPRIALLDPSTEIELAVRSPDSAGLAQLLLPADVARELGLEGSLSGSVRLATGPRGIEARIALRARDAVVRGVAIEDLTLRAGVADGVLAIERLDARAGASILVGAGSIRIAERRFDAFTLDMDAPDLDAFGRAVGLAPQWLAGRAQVRARLDGPFTAPTGELAAEFEALRVAGLDVAYARVAARGDGAAIHVDDLELLLPMIGTVQAAGRVDVESGRSATARIDRFDLTALYGSVSLSRPARLEFVDGRIDVEALEFAGGDGALNLREGRYDGGWCVDADLSAARVGRVLRAFGLAVPSTLVLDGSASVALATTPDGARDGAIALSVTADVADLSDAPLPRGFRMRGSSRAGVELGGTWRAPRGRIDMRLRDLEVEDADGKVRLSGTDASVAALVGDVVTLESCVLALPSAGRVEASGTIGVRFDLDRFTHAEFDRALSAPLDIDVRVEAPDLSPLADALEILRRTSGALEADVNVTGTLNEPAVGGHVRLSEGSVKLGAALPTLAGLELDLVLGGRRVTIETAHGTFGGGDVSMTGFVALDGLEPVLDLAVKGTSVPLVRSAEVSLRSDVEVSVKGPWHALALTGNAALRDARFEQRLDLETLRSMFDTKSGGGGSAHFLELPPIREAPFDAMTLALDVRSDKPVRVRTPLFRAELLTRFAVRGTGAAPTLSGSVDLSAGRVALPASKLDITRGRVDLDSDDPGRARIDVAAEGRVSGYEVRARVTGTTDDPVVELTSIPPATQEDLALLLLAGRQPGSHGLGVDQDRVFGEVASHVARDIAYEWFGDAGESFADRLELSTGGDVTQTGADTIEVRFRLTGPSRGEGRTVYLRGERDVYDRVNMGMRFVLRMP